MYGDEAFDMTVLEFRVGTSRSSVGWYSPQTLGAQDERREFIIYWKR